MPIPIFSYWCHTSAYYAPGSPATSFTLPPPWILHEWNCISPRLLQNSLLSLHFHPLSGLSFSHNSTSSLIRRCILAGGRRKLYEDLFYRSLKFSSRPTHTSSFFRSGPISSFSIPPGFLQFFSKTWSWLRFPHMHWVYSSVTCTHFSCWWWSWNYSPTIS